jgi:eukaryotic-like serine/threonine-protein kinase
MTDRNVAQQTLGRYQLLVAIARGGMGQVWLGRLQGARGFNKVVAIKTLLPNEADRPRLEAMLAEEARLGSLIQHPNVVRTMELGEDEGLLYLVMEWVDGEPLGFLHTRADERGGMPVGVAVALVSQVLAGLHAAHELGDESGPLGVVHRDVSPHNILVTYDGVAKLLDFGIAKATEQPSSTTDTGEIKGKFSYMAPEQILGNEVDRRCDVFAAGIVLYWLTTGRHPFKHHNTAAVIHAITGGTPVPAPSSFVSDFPPALERVLLKALQKNKDDRYATAEEMRVALEHAMPDAFSDGGRKALREFMERAVGDRKLARREAVRRAQLAADTSDGSGARNLQLAPSQSVSSLRAISISQPAPEGASQLVAAPVAEAPVQRRAPKAPWIAASAGVLLALVAVLPQLLGSERAAQPGGASGIHVGAPLASRALASSPSPAPSAVSVTPSAAPAPLASLNEAPAIASAAPSGKPVVHRATAKARPAPLKGAGTSASGSSDLIAPDYAR